MDEQIEAGHRPAVDERIELAYTPTAADFREALAARSRTTRAGRRTRMLTYVVGVCCLLAGTIELAGGEGVDTSLVVMVVAVLFLIVGVPRLQASQFHRLAAQKGEFKVAVEAAGVTIANHHSTSTLTWQAAPYYVETPGLFVLLSADKNNSCLTILPKRGTADPDGLGALLARHASAPARG
ncbi:YcxB family protein [Kitasatospora sp. NPDC096204]|uniref:YcxB family protein n=1 Tax=Kitasatospora sp. NPDC096204 TaxID=3364094 RepID=UPI003812D428